MTLKKLTLILLLSTITSVLSQNVQLSKFSNISIITSGPGDNLYEKFGHTAIRVKDPVLQLDALYNYGMFDFNAPNFELNFVKGYMKYKLAAYPFHYALKSAKEDKRWVKEQILNLTQKEKTAVFYFLQNNAKPENATYFYDPFFDNCATKPRDIIEKTLGNALVYNDSIITENKSFRELMNEKINVNTWGSFGINIALGSKLDQITTLQSRMYLPDYVFSALAAAKIKRDNKTVNLVKKTTVLLDYKTKDSKPSALSPFIVFLVFLMIGLFITYKDYKNAKRSKWLDFLIFFFSGIAGIVIVFLWFFTNHSTAPNNFNILWAFPLNSFIAFLMLQDQPKKWIVKYLLFLMSILYLIPIVWFTKIQLFTWQLLPLLILMVVRYAFLYKKLSIAKL